MIKHSRFFAATSAALVLPCFLLTGCHNSQNLDAVATTPQATSQVVALVGKQMGDTGKKLARQATDAPPALIAGSEAATVPPKPLTHWTPVEKLPLSSGGKGLIVCEPVAVNAGAGVADFGAGCGRWLHLSVAGLPQLDQTPLWSSLNRAQTELKRTDFRLTPQDARRLSGILGVSHAATGQIVGTAAHCTLTYQLYALPKGTAVGPPERATGTEAQVLNQLPQMAGRLAASLGVPQTTPLAAVSATPAQMALLGHLPWYSDTSPPVSQTQQLQAMAPHVPLAGVFLVNSKSDFTTNQWAAVVKTLLAQELGNGLVWAQLASSDPSVMVPRQAQIAAARKHFPHNYLFASADTWVQRVLQNENTERQAAEMAVQDAPRNPDAWLTLGYTIGVDANNLRQGRVASSITVSEWQFLNTAYTQWLSAVSQATRLDPLYGKAWTRVAKAATFADHPALADKALWKGIALNKTDPESYSWGLEMYQNKWDGNPAKLQQIAQALATLPYTHVFKGLVVAEALGGNKKQPGQFGAQSQALLASLLARTEKVIAANPGDAQAHYDHAYALKLMGNHPDAIAEFKNVTVLRPRDPQSYLDLALEYDDAHHSSLAMAAYHQALALDPASAVAHYNLGWDLKAQGQFAPAEAEMRQAVKQAPFYPEGHAGLGQVLMDQQRKSEAIPEMRKALQLNHYLMPTLTELPYLLDKQGHYAESVTAGQRALKLLPKDEGTLVTMADDYLHLKKWDLSIQMSQRALEINSNDAISHANLGEAYIGAGRKAEARAEWNKVLAGNDSRMATIARQMLAKYP